MCCWLLVRCWGSWQIWSNWRMRKCIRSYVRKSQKRKRRSVFLCWQVALFGAWVVELALLLVVTLDAYPLVALAVELVVALDVVLVEALSDRTAVGCGVGCWWTVNTVDVCYSIGGSGSPCWSVHVVARTRQVAAWPRAPSITHWLMALNSSSGCSGMVAWR